MQRLEVSGAVRPIYVSLGVKRLNKKTCGPGSSVGIATDYGLDGPGSNPGFGAHPASCTTGTGSFPGVEAAGAWG